MAEQPVVEKMSQLQVDAGKTVMFVYCLSRYLKLACAASSWLARQIARQRVAVLLFVIVL